MQATLRTGRRLLRAGIGRLSDVQSCRHRQPRRGRDAAHPRRAGARARRPGRGSRRSPYTPTPTGTATFVREADIAYPLGSAVGPALPRPTPCWSGPWSRPAPTPPGSAGASSPRTRRSPSCARGSASPSSGPSAEAMRKLGDKIGAKLIAEEVGVPVAPWSRGAVASLDDALRAGERDRLPADAQGHRGRRRARHPHGHLRRRPDRRLRAHQPGGGARLRQRRGVPGAPGHRRAARRGAGHRRRPGHRVGARRARLLGAAAQPEDHRGVGLAGALAPRRPPS